MVDPVFRKAKEALDLLSADPEAQELARRRQEAQWFYQVELGLARAEGLREGVRAACDLLGIELCSARQRTIDELDPAQLETLLTALRRDRCWPSE